MSGFEIAGVLLGALPLIFEGVKRMGVVFKNTKSWWVFEKSLEEFTATVIGQEIAYRQVLERLIDPLDITDEEYNSLLSDPSSALWYQPDVISKLQQRFHGEQYSWFMNNLRDLKESVIQLHNLLPMDKIHHLDSASLESQLYRLQTSFSNEKDRLLAKITKINNELHEFLHRSTDLPRHSTKKTRSSFQELQSQANELYECLAFGWECCCPTEHVVGITAHIPPGSSRKSANNKGHLTLLFDSQAHRKQFKIQIEEAIYNQSTEPVVKSSTIDFNPLAASALKKNTALRKYQKSVSNPTTGSIKSALVLSSLYIASLPTPEPSPRKSFIKRATQKIKQKSSLLARAQLVSHGQGKASLNNSSNNSSIITTNSAATATTLTTPTDLTYQISTASSKSHVSDSVTTISTPTSSKVRFADVSAPAAPATPEPQGGTQSLINICHLATGHISDHHKRSTLLSVKKNRVILEHNPLHHDTIQTSEIYGIDTVSGYLPLRLDRLYVGMQLALTLLSLVNSAWVPERLEKKDIFLICAKGGYKHGTSTRPFGPYFSSSSRKIEGQGSRAWHAQSSLLLLGVLLLELYHGKRLDQQKVWEDNLIDGAPNQFTVYCSAFQWAQQTRESIERDWGKDLGGELSDAILKCLRFDFEQDNEYGDAKLANMVYKEVVAPLEKCFPKHFS